MLPKGADVMILLLLSYLGTSLYCAAYAVHCFQKKHWLPAGIMSALVFVPIACGAVLLLLQ